MTTKSKVLLGLAVAWLLVLTAIQFVTLEKVLSIEPGGATKLGSQIQPEPFWFGNGLQLGSDGSFENRIPLYMGTGQNQVAWCNNTGKTVIVSGYRGILISPSVVANPLGVTPASFGTPIASTTLVMFVGTSTKTTVTDALIEPVYGSLIDTALIATGTTNNTVINSTKNSGTNGVASIPVLNGICVIEVLENPYTWQQGVSETATSTARGYNIYSIFNVDTF